MDASRLALCVCQHETQLTGREIAGIFAAKQIKVVVKTHRRVVDNKLYHLGIAVVEFLSEEDKKKALEIAFDDSRISVTELDQFLLTRHLAVVFGIPNLTETFLKELFADYSISCIHIVDNAASDGSSAVIVSFSRLGCVKAFVREINGAVLCGNKLSVCEFEYTETAKSVIDSVGFLSDELDFTLYYYDRVYNVWSGSVIAFSAVIANEVTTNPKLSEFICPQIPGPFELIVDYLQGQEIQINDQNCVFLSIMAKALEIDQLERITAKFIYETSDFESCVIILENLYNYDEDISYHLSFIARRLTLEQLKENTRIRLYPVELLEYLISSNDVTLSEDDLFQFVQYFRNIDKTKYRRLMKQIHIERLSKNFMHEVLTDTSLDLNLMRPGLLQLANQLPKRSTDVSTDPRTQITKNIIHCGVPLPVGSIFNMNAIIFNGNLFSGIIEYIIVTYGKDWSSAIQIIPSSIGHGHPSVLVNPQHADHLGTLDMPHSYIDFQFKMQIALTGYSLKTHSHSQRGHMKSWNLYGKAGNRWVLIHHVEDSDDLAQRGAEKYYEIEGNSGSYSVFRLKNCAQNTAGFHTMRLSRIEFFGVMNNH